MWLTTSLSDLEQTLKFYRQRWGIEMMFKDCKTGGYNLEQTSVSERRFLALFLLVVFAYSLATIKGAFLRRSSLKHYLVRAYREKHRPFRRYSDFSLGLARYAFIDTGSLLRELAVQLMATKPHKRLYFQRGIAAQSCLQLAF